MDMNHGIFPCNLSVFSYCQIVVRGFTNNYEIILGNYRSSILYTIKFYTINSPIMFYIRRHSIHVFNIFGKLQVQKH